ncbi:protein NEDD1 isoform X3 [Clupea harengus]|uniref:Protein NEDD1 isoform X3 n=1 Tax=Clupea harengus TaxID=7950 RepID=A0A6P8FCG0_CLUHA|nr:protein NEDD1 isoform X3 [Clupea harengus]
MEEVLRLVSSGDCIKIWDSNSMKVLDQFSPHSSTHPVSQVCWNSNNQYVVSASSVGDKIVVSSLKSSPIPVMELAEGKKQTRVCINSTTQYLVSSGLDGIVNIWDLKSKKLYRNIKDHKQEVTCVSYNVNDSYIVSGSISGELILHNVSKSLSSKPFGHGASQPIRDVRYSLVKRSMLGSISDVGTVALWDAPTQKEVHTFDPAHKGPTSALAFSPANDLLFVSVGLDKKIICYDTSSKIIVRNVKADSPLTAIEFFPDGATLVIGSTQGQIYQYDLRNLSAPVKTVAAHKTSVTCLRFQNTQSRVKSSKVVSGKSSVSHSKRTSGKPSTTQSWTLTPTPAAQPSPQPTPEPYPERGDGQAHSTGIGLDGFSREADGQHSTDALFSMDKVARVGRASLDIFSPIREGTNTEMRGGRNSLDIFSPVCDDHKFHRSASDSSGKRGGDLDLAPPFSGISAQLKTPLGTSGGRCYSPLSVFQTPPPIKEEEAQTETQEGKTSEKDGSSSQESDTLNTPPALQNLRMQSSIPPYLTPEISLRRANDVSAHLTYNSPFNGARPTLATAGPGVSESVAASLSDRIAETVGAEGTGAPLTNQQIVFIRNMIQETLEDLRDSCHRDIVNLQVEMVRQFCIQLNEFHEVVEKYSVNSSLVAEIEKLKEENKRLRTNY